MTSSATAKKKMKPVSQRGLPFLRRTRGELYRLMKSEMSPKPIHSALFNLLNPCPPLQSLCLSRMCQGLYLMGVGRVWML